MFEKIDIKKNEVSFLCVVASKLIGVGGCYSHVLQMQPINLRVGAPELYSSS